MFDAYYQSELTYLRELGHEFARLNPALAEAFGQPGADADVERLLQGFAFLTARVRKRIDDALPRAVAGLAELVAPHVLRSFPSCTVVAFSPDVASLRGRHTVPTGTELASRPVRGTTCRFRTVGDMDLVPLRLTDAQLDRSVAGRPAVRLSLRTNESAHDAVFAPSGFRLFLSSTYPLASTLALWFERHMSSLRYESIEGSLDLGRDTIRRATLDQPLAPWPHYSAPGLRLLQEYCAFPARFLFFDVVNLDRIPPGGPSEFTLVFEFHSPPDLPERITAKHFQLHAAPAVNLFSCSAVPIRDHRRTEETLIRADGIDPTHAEVFSVDSVLGVRSDGKGVRRYEHFYDFTSHSHSGPTYSTRRAPSPLNRGIDTYLRVSAASEPIPEDEVLSLDLTCTNRDLAGCLGVGDLRIATANSPAIAPYASIVPVSSPVRYAPNRAHWRLIGEMAQQLRDLTEPGVLASLLALHESAATVEPAARDQSRSGNESSNGLGSVRRAPLSNAVQQATLESVRRLIRGAPVNGLRTELEIDETTFAGLGDASLFATVLDRVFADRVSINCFHELSVHVRPSGRTWTFAPHGLDVVR